MGEASGAPELRSAPPPPAGPSASGGEQSAGAGASMNADVHAYDSSLEQLLTELERLNVLIRFQVWRFRQRAGEDEGLRAAYIAEDEPEELLNRITGTPAWTAVPLPAGLLDTAQARLDELSQIIERRTAASLEAGLPPRLVALAGLFGLGPFEVDVVLACLALELDGRYERLYAYLHDDLTRRQPTVGLVLDLFCPDIDAKAAGRRLLGAAEPLRYYGLVELADQPAASWLTTPLRLDPRVSRFLLDDDEIDERLRSLAQLVVPEARLEELTVPAGLRARLASLMRAGPGDLVLYLQGSYGTGRRSTAAACCAVLGVNLLVVDGARLVAADAEQFELLVRLLDREARLQGAMLLWEGFDTLLADDRRPRLASLMAVLNKQPGPVFLAGEQVWEPADALSGKSFVRVELPLPGSAERLALWRVALGADAAAALDLAAVANTFRLTGGQIRDAAATARGLARARAAAAPELTQADLQAACRLQSNRKLAELAQKLTPHFGWDDLVLPADQMAQLREIANHVRYRAVVYETWGFDAKLALGKGLNVLFTGPPGTGKTMAADVLAGVLGLDLYRIDLSTVVSKYIGETEKNLARIFAEAQSSNAVLFFDEADALFGKRTQVRDAHDRYANVEISYLLQKMEEYQGLVILATNLRKNIDEAFVRRLHFMVDFPLPGPADRRRIWAQIWPVATPRDADVDLDVLAEQVEVAGGNIRNIALASAFLAAADGGTVTMRHIRDAVRREYQKIGKVLTHKDLEAEGEGRHADQGDGRRADQAR